MAKMYYTEEEAAAKLSITVEELAQYVDEQKLRVFKDGARNMYMASEVDTLVTPEQQVPPPQEIEEVELTPVEDTGMPAGFVEPQQPAPAEKEDTSIGAEGVSIFDEEDLEIGTADPMAKTQIAPSIEDQMAIEGVGSGSGLLDLTHESDDTSLGEVIDRIDLEEPVEEEASAAFGGGYGEPAAVAAPGIVTVPELREALDAASGLFNGLLVGSALVGLLLGAVTLAVGMGVVPRYLTAIKENIAAVLIGIVLLVGICGIIGLFVGKSIVSRQQAIQQMSG